jgi:hypothetical protein
MSAAEALPGKPLFRAPVVIPTNWCVSCMMTLRTEDEYKAHVRMFPLHNIKKITRLQCPVCGREVGLEYGRFSDHWTDYSRTRKCSGSGRQA